MADMLTDVSLGKLVQLVAADLHREKVKLPLKDQRSWHALFFGLKKQPRSPGRPEFLDRMMFDWDSEYPKSEALSDFLNALHFTASVSAQNPRFDFITIADDDAGRWSKDVESMDNDVKAFVESALSLARHEFNVSSK